MRKRFFPSSFGELYIGAGGKNIRQAALTFITKSLTGLLGLGLSSGGELTLCRANEATSTISASRVSSLPEEVCELAQAADR